MSEAELATLRTDDYEPSTLSSVNESVHDKQIDERHTDFDGFSPQFHSFSTQAVVSVDPHMAVPQPDLIRACQEGDLKAVKQLVNKENINAGALHHAASNNQWRVCQFLIEQGADINARIEPMNATPLLWACRNGHAYIVKLLVGHGADVNVVDNSGFTALHLAVHSSNVLMVIYVLHLELDVDRTDFGNRSPLHWAIVQGDHLSVEALLKAGAWPNMPDGEGISPIALAINTSKSELCIKLLLENGADPNDVNLSGCVPSVWLQGCEKAGRLPNGLPRQSIFISPETAKILTFVAPILVIPVALNIPHLVGTLFLGIPLTLLCMWCLKYSIEKYVIPYCWKGPKALLQSTLLAGVFVSIYECIVCFWFSRMSSTMFKQRLWSSLFLMLCLVIVTTTYLAAVFMDPGKIEPKSMAKRLASMNELMDRGLFDSVHFCIHTYVAIPTRARYDSYLDRVVCRYDHYCPWLYNTIGLRNHRVFIIFILAMGLSIPVLGYQYVSYCREFGVSSFGVGLSILVLVQSVWIYVLCLLQLVQIARGTTTYEVSYFEDRLIYQTDPIRAYSSLPKDHPRAFEVLGDMSSASSLLKHSTGNNRCKKYKHSQNIWLRITGLGQVLLAWRLFRRKKRISLSDNGIQRNCADFWLGGGNIMSPTGMYGRLDGNSVDYSTLMYLEPTVSV